MLGRLALDARTMTAAFWLLAGVVCGTVHFTLLWRGTRLLTSGGALFPAIGYGALRLAGTTIVLGLAAGHGAVALLAAGAGMLIARPLVLRATRVRA